MSVCETCNCTKTNCGYCPAQYCGCTATYHGIDRCYFP